MLRTTFAPIKVTVLNGVGYTVSARTTFGRIKSEADLTLNGQIGDGVIEGKIGGGGAVHPEHADVVILGFGQIGRELALQMAMRTSRACCNTTPPAAPFTATIFLRTS